jgi:hypothetical protein
MDGALVLVRPGLNDALEGSVWQPIVLIDHDFMDGTTPGRISTKKEGTIEITSDGKQMWMVGEKR